MENIMNIAVIVAGIDEEYQHNVMDGINLYSKKNNANISYFAAFGGVLANSQYDVGEYNIYNLINLSKFDGTILMTNTISSPEAKRSIIQRVIDANIPSVVFDCDQYPQFYNVSVDNFKAMEEMVRHIIETHNIKNVNYISGPLANPEALARYNAFLRVIKDNNIPFDKNRVFYGDFRGTDGKKAIEAFISSGLNMPDAIICANDAMALAAISTLEKNGYTIPDDILVTGFDNTYNARNFGPEITSVKRPLSELGYLACEIIADLKAGKTRPRINQLPTQLIFSESCGCKSCDIDNDIKDYKKRNYHCLESFDNHVAILNKMMSSLAEKETEQENFEVISDCLSEIGCNEFCICLCDDWHGRFTQQINEKGDDCVCVEEYHVNGYTKLMSAPLIWENGLVSTVDSFYSDDMFPVPHSSGGNVSYFMPIHFRERCLGYCIISNSSFPLESRIFHTWIMNISNSIENIRKLNQLNSAIAELDKLYVIDPLCDIYNRNGFVRATGDIFKKCILEHNDITIMFIDMDGLKMINDNYGHREGDFALKTLASAMKECCYEGEICARFGGDEFLIFSDALNTETSNILAERIRKRLKEINSQINKPYEIAASIGCYITEAREEFPLFKVITKADEKMYEEKKKKKTSRYLRHT